MDDDRRAQLETVEVKSDLVRADTQVRHERAMVGHYRQVNAEADRLEAEATQDLPDASQLRDEASLMRMVADASSLVSFDWSRLEGTGANAKYNYKGRVEDILQTTEYLSVPKSQPVLTAAAADRHRARSERYALCVVATLVLLALLTVARISPVWPRRWIAGISMVAGVVVIPMLVFTEWGV
ncbi:hypothetical protein [Streptomyces avidinii]|uniref:Uncharacterized protein n=1 Tax=Streptomyces avidinii TaxID=1895 RepID=A0ABS4LFI9_STRAV|nr:hypothetical protein [Streptomyces avidinii]MBP2040892.1 hypothetical protein [Streptomyces avidinii]